MNSFLSKNIFLLDAAGALTSALFIGKVLPILNIGISKDILDVLAVIAFMFSLYSFSCYFFKKKDPSWLKAIIGANIFYCVLTAGVVGRFFNNLSSVALFYFIGEILVILALVAIEYRVLTHQNRLAIQKEVSDGNVKF